MIDYQQIVRDQAVALGADPAVVLAVAKQESGINPSAVGDNGCSFGIFQENICGGAGSTVLNAGGSIADLQDPVTATIRFIDRFRRVVDSGFTGTPGEIAAAAQRPFDPAGYASKVDALYAGYGSTPSDTTSVLGSGNASPAPSCGVGFVWDPATGKCRNANITDIFPGIYPKDPGAAITAIGSALPNPLDGIAKAIEDAKTATGSAVRNLAVAGVVIGAIALFGYAGVKRLV